MIGEKLIEALVRAGGDVIKRVVKDRDLAAKLEHELKMAAIDQDGELQRIALQADRDVEVAVQQTAQTEQQQNDTYTKRTRPALARRSFNLAVVYVGFCLATLVTPMPDTAVDWSILTVIASPVLTYMGVRTFDKWRSPGA